MVAAVIGEAQLAVCVGALSVDEIGSGFGKSVCFSAG